MKTPKFELNITSLPDNNYFNRYVREYYAYRQKTGFKLITMLEISKTVSLPLSEIGIHAIRAQGAGGQNVNKVATAIHLRFDIRASSLPEVYKDRLLAFRDYRISKDGIVIIKAQRYRSQEQNREDALARLRDLIIRARQTPKKRKATKPSKASQKKRIESKIRRGRLKASRGKVDFD